MQSLILRCNLNRCNVDGNLTMSIEKCVLSMKNEAGEPSPCYYLNVKDNEEAAPDEAWKRFDSYVDKTKQKIQK